MDSLRRKLKPEHWRVLRDAWEVGVAEGAYRLTDREPEAAAAEWTVIAVSDEEDVLAEEGGAFYLVRGGTDPRLVEVTGTVLEIAADVFRSPPDTPG